MSNVHIRKAGLDQFKDTADITISKNTVLKVYRILTETSLSNDAITRTLEKVHNTTLKERYTHWELLTLLNLRTIPRVTVLTLLLEGLDVTVHCNWESKEVQQCKAIADLIFNDVLVLDGGGWKLGNIELLTDLDEYLPIAKVCSIFGVRGINDSAEIAMAFVESHWNSVIEDVSLINYLEFSNRFPVETTTELPVPSGGSVKIEATQLPTAHWMHRISVTRKAVFGVLY